MNRSVQFFKLASDPRQPGLACRKDGLALAGHPLLSENGEGLSPRPAAEIQEILDAAFGWDTDIRADALLPGLASVARFLNKGDLPLAMIGSLLLKLPDIPDSSPLAKAARDAAAKAGYNPAQARDENGRWTQDAGSNAFQPPVADIRPSLTDALLQTVPALQQATPALLETGGEAGGGVLEGLAPNAPEAAAALLQTGEEAAGGGVLEDLAPEAISLLARLAPYLGGAAATVLGVLIPTNRSNIHEGEIPDAPGLTYRSDEGIVDVYALDPSGNPMVVYHGVPDREGFYYDDQGLIVGRHVGRAALFDPEALQEIAAGKTGMPAGSEPPAGNPPPTTLQPDEDRPRFCPPPTPENIRRRSIWSLLYQSQITGLPPGFDVLFQGVRFDGCVEAIRHLQEAKGRMPPFLTRASDDELRRTEFYARTMRQASRQNAAASGYYDDWYFANERLHEFFTREFRLYHFDNIVTHHVNAIFFRRIEDAFAIGGGDSISDSSKWPFLQSIPHPAPTRETLP